MSKIITSSKTINHMLMILLAFSYSSAFADSIVSRTGNAIGDDGYTNSGSLLAIFAVAACCALVQLYKDRRPGADWFSISPFIILSVLWMLGLVMLAQLAIVAVAVAPIWILFKLFSKKS